MLKPRLPGFRLAMRLAPTIESLYSGVEVEQKKQNVNNAVYKNNEVHLYHFEIHPYSKQKTRNAVKTCIM